MINRISSSATVSHLLLISHPSRRPLGLRSLQARLAPLTFGARGFKTIPSQIHQAVYRRFDQPNRPSLIPSPPHHQNRQRFNKPHSTSNHFYGFPAWAWLLGGSVTAYYLAHLEKVELTGRWRFMDTSVALEKSVGEQIYVQTLSQFRSKILPPSHPTARFITTVAHRIIQASSDLSAHKSFPSDIEPIDLLDSPSTTLSSPFGGRLDSPHPSLSSEWQIHVIDEPKIKNAFVIPGGKIFVFTGILPICQSEAGLATVLGHEVAHQVLRHPAERMSSMKVIFLFTTLLTIVGIDPGICRALVTLLMTLPNSRRSEVEADQIGLRIMASACYDPREAVGVWRRMDQYDRTHPLAKRATEFFQTHPSHDRRIEKITSWLPEAQTEMERKCGSTTKSYQDFYQRWNP